MAAGPAATAMVDPSTMRRVDPLAGQYDLCGPGPGTGKGEAGRLCDACSRREVYRAVECGQDAISP